MRPLIFIGDELTAAGFRLAGIDTVCPPPDELEQTFDEALASAQLIIVGASCARALPVWRLASATRQRTPLISVVPDALNEVPEDPATLVESALGLIR